MKTKSGILVLLAGCLVLLVVQPCVAQAPDPVHGPFSPSPSYGPHPTGPSYGPFVPYVPPRTNPPATHGTGAQTSPAALANKPFSGYEPQKPFSGYRPSPAISPYMNLYTFNPDQFLPNYNRFVQPLVQQNAMDRQFRLDNQRSVGADRDFSGQIGYLNAATRYQDAAIGYLDEKVETTDSVLGIKPRIQSPEVPLNMHRPGYYMNHHSYFGTR